MNPDLPTTTPDKLVIGLYVHLDLGWMDHPFTFSHFRIKSQEQIDTIRSLGLQKIHYDPKRSDAAPSPNATNASPSAPVTVDPAPTAETVAAQESKRRRVEQNRQLREKIGGCEREFVKAAGVVRNISRNLLSNPKEAVAGANQLTDEMLQSLLGDSDVAIHLMNDKVAGEEVYYHSLNVAMLSAILGKAMGLDAETMRAISLGALFHDIGKLDIPDKIVLKKDPLTRAEENLFQQHCSYGVELGKRVGLAPAVIAVIAQHHETLDGKGYPAGLADDKISIAARVVGVVNAYDNLCNPANIAAAMTPHEALSMMYAKQRGKHDGVALGKLVHTLGVFPPGTVVRLSNDMTGMVISVNDAKPLRPTVMVYDPDVPKREAIILDLETEPEINIGKALRPGQLPREVFEYLSPRKRTTYYFDATARSGA
jgi:putative nucleotidyltransferase with HDIG domain